MDAYSDVIRRVRLFRGIGEEERGGMFGCLGARVRSFAAGEAILLAGDPPDRVGVLLDGRASIVREDAAGVRTLVAGLGPGDLFAELFACAEAEALPVSVFAGTAAAVLFLDYRKIVRSCPSACPFHARLVENMLAVVAEKALFLNRRLGHLSRRTTREKLLSYLAEQAERAGSRTFAIPFNRQELADYLCVERSAMSAQLGKLRDEGILRFQGSRFELLV